MERLNDIFKRDTRHVQRGQSFQQRRREDAERLVTSTPPPASPAPQPMRSSPAGAPPRRPLPEQTARIGEYGRAYQPERQRAQSSLPSSTSPAGSIAPVPPGRAPQGHQNGYGAKRIQGGNQPVRAGYPGASAHQGDAFQSGMHADVQGEWDEDGAATMRYGDWESDIYDVPSVPAVPARQLEQEARPPASPLSRGANRIAQSYPQVKRSFATRELRRTTDEEEITPPSQYAPSTRQLAQQAPSYPPRPSVPPAHYTQATPSLAPAQQVTHTQRVTQPLNRPPRTDKAERAEPQPIPAPYTNTKAPCPICKGKGYLRADVPYGHPNFGKPIACECKERERAERRRFELEAISNLGDMKDKSFENFKLNVLPGVQRAYQVARQYAEEPSGWLLFIGRVGCGKTHLAAAIANRALARGSRVLFSTVSDLLDHLRASFTPNATEVYDHLFQEMCEAEVLVLDDLGAHNSSSWANEKLFQLLNYRYNSRFPTIITANNTGLQGLDERIVSRIMDTSLVTKITIDQADDYRLRNPRRE